MGVRLITMAARRHLSAAEKISLQDLYPLAGEERDSDQRTMGVGRW